MMVWLSPVDTGIWQSCTQNGTGLKSLRAVDILGTKFPKCLTLVLESASTRNTQWLEKGWEAMGFAVFQFNFLCFQKIIIVDLDWEMPNIFSAWLDIKTWLKHG